MGQRFISSDPEHQLTEDWVTLHAAAAETVGGTGTLEVELPQDCRAVMACLDVTAAAAAVGDTLIGIVQTLMHRPGGDVWVDVIGFTAVLGNGGAVRHYEKIVAGLEQATFAHSDDVWLEPKRHIIGSRWRCRWLINLAVAPSFTFTIALQPL